jgi:hypothetical protein
MNGENHSLPAAATPLGSAVADLLRHVRTTREVARRVAETGVTSNPPTSFTFAERTVAALTGIESELLDLLDQRVTP